VTGVWPNPGAYIVFEVLARIVNPLKLFIQKDIEGDGNGYPLDREDKAAGVGMSKWETPEKMRPIGFSVLPLFCDHGELNRGLFKVPVYTLPTWRGRMPEMDDLDRTRPAFRTSANLWVRLNFHDEESRLKCHPSFSHLYGLPQVHDFKKSRRARKSEARPKLPCVKASTCPFTSFAASKPVRPIRVRLLYYCSLEDTSSKTKRAACASSQRPASIR